ncbi:MAG: hypothetical protein Q8K57_12785 [Thiobacillus sp.]|nr:hypothetical protein [Thiobacillus sp.]
MKLTPQQQIIGRRLVEAADQLAHAKRIGNLPGNLARAISQDIQTRTRLKVADLIVMADKHVPSALKIAKDKAPGGEWSTLEFVGVTREQLPVILKALGASDFDIKEAVGDPAVAFRLLATLAKETEERGNT